MNEPIKLAIVYGSTREGRLCDRLVAWVAGQIARRQGFTLDLIDSVSDEWQAKPVAFVSYGGVSGGLRAVEQLRQVFAELHAVAIRDTVSFADVWSRFDAAGELLEPGRTEDSMTSLLAQLTWWARTLRDARRDSPPGLMRA